MPVAKGSKKPEYTQEERADIVERVCALYESQNATIESCCDAIGISRPSFSLWCAQFSEFSERYKKAKVKQKEFYWEEVIRPLADTGLQRLLKGEVKEETKSEGTQANDGSFIVSKKVVTTSEILPNASVVIFANKGMYPDIFADRQKVDATVTNEESWFMKLPLAKRLEIMKIANSKDE